MSAPLMAGKAGHLAMAHHFMGHSSLQAMTEFEMNYKQWAIENVPPSGVRHWENARDCLAAWFDEGKTLPFKVRPNMPGGCVEKELVVPFILGDGAGRGVGFNWDHDADG